MREIAEMTRENEKTLREEYEKREATMKENFEKMMEKINERKSVFEQICSGNLLQIAAYSVLVLRLVRNIYRLLVSFVGYHFHTCGSPTTHKTCHSQILWSS